MATQAADQPRSKPLTVDMFERVLAIATALLFGVVIVALARGYAEWGRVPPLVWAHLVTILTALALTPVMLLRKRGDLLHRRLGTVWVAAMLLTALISFGVRDINRGGFSVIHLLSAWTLIQVPRLWWAARHHNIRAHRSGVRGMVTGALLIAGFFTFPFNRLLGHFLFG